ncbi:MAG: hypothetical protein WC612_07035 [Bdellovibrionales bacterium]
MAGLSNSLSVLGIGLRLGFRQTMQQKILFVGAFLVYATIMVFYAGIIKMISPADLAKHGYSHAQLIWYLAITEYMLFSCVSWVFKEVQSDFHSGQMSLSLLRPYPTSLTRVSIWCGEALARLLVLFVPMMGITALLAGAFVMTPLQTVGMVLSLPLGAVITECAFYMIGASCLWFAQAEPASWVWQKAVFLFGAMIWPMAFYPLWMKGIMWATPFPAVLAAAGSWALHHSALYYALAFLHQVFWAAAFLALLRWFDGVIMRKIQSGEGA